ncbi:hypothetical protein [Pseudomonas phage vB_Pae_HMKU_23]|nr:hypothetical protein [Pseudomonas phage vB_Pae_HMKU_23]
MEVIWVRGNFIIEVWMQYFSLRLSKSGYPPRYL